MSRLLLILAATVLSSAAAADAPLWSQPLGGPDWGAPRDAVHNGLRVDAQGAQVLSNEFGALWQIEVDNGGDVRQRSTVPDAQLYSRATLIGQAPDQVFTLTSSSVDLDLHCALQRQNADGSQRWRWSYPINGLDILPCRTVAQLASGDVLFADRARIASLDDDGAQRWSTAFADHGLVGLQVQRLLPLPNQRVLVAGSASSQGASHPLLWVLNAQTGAPLELQLLQGGRLLAVSGLRPLGAGEFELLAQLQDDAGATGQLLRLRISSAGAVLQTSALEALGGAAPMRVVAHASGFALVGQTAGAPELRVYDGTQLRWRVPVLAVPELMAVTADGAVALGDGNAVERFDNAGIALPAPLLPALAADRVLGLQHGPDSSLWVHSQGSQDRFPREMQLARYGLSAAPLHATRISLPQDGPQTLSVHRAADGTLRYAGWLNAASAQLAEPALVLRSITPSGVVESAAQRSFPDRSIHAAAGLQDGWVVLDQALTGGALQLSGLALDGSTRWSQTLTATKAALACDQRQRCVLATREPDGGDQIRLIDGNGASLGNQAGGGSEFLTPVVDGDRLRGLQFDSAGAISTLLAAEALPLAVLARSSDPDLYASRLNTGQWPLPNSLLGWLPDRLNAYGTDAVLWSLPHGGELVALANRHDRLFAVRQPAAGAAQRVLRIDPGSGVVQSDLQLPVSTPTLRTGCKQIQAGGSRFGADHACIDAVDDNVRWLLARSADGSTATLLADRHGQPWRTLAAAIHARELLALPGDAVLVMESSGGPAEQMQSRLRLYQVELFRDGME